MIKKLSSYIKRIYKNTSYQNKLVLSSFILILVPIILLTTYSYYKNIQTVKTEAVSISELYLQQVRSSIDARITELVNTAKFISRHETVREILEKSPGSLPIGEQIEDLNELDVIIANYLFSTNIYDIRLYVDDGFIYSNRNTTTYNLSDINDFGWAGMFSEFYAVVYYTEPYEFTYISNNVRRIISAVIPIRNSSDFEQIAAVICVDMLEEDLLEIMAAADYINKGEILITDINYKPLSIYTSLDNNHYPEIINYIKEQETNPVSTGITVVDNNIIGVAPLWNTWVLISIAFMEDMVATQSYLGLRYLLVIVSASIGVYMIAKIYAKQNSKRITNLAKQVRVAESGDFNVQCVVDSADEIGDLQTSFNYMVKKIYSLLQEQYDLGRDLNVMELRVLQAQINPHFLYNTLDLILWAARRGDMDQVSDIVIKLSKFYRLSLSNGDDYISLSDEIEHVRLYIELQNLRFTKQIDLSVDMDESLKDYKIMKLLLQPIVENSIIHGITNSDIEKGEIYISAALESEIIHLSVKDNGIGMDQATISKIMSYGEVHNKEYSKFGGYGLRNVIDRLRLYYSNEANIVISATPNVGTEINIIIPYKQ
ncbi:MAG TPA: hypothetical protein DIW17_00635 [Clostridiales bacterium]|nr:hypothetical protein [Clostridiales bacterium]